MRRSTLILSLVLCVLVLTTPLLMWLAGRWLPFVDERWMNALGSLVFTVPLGLALAAIVLAVHGVLLNRFLAEEAFDLLAEETAAADAAMTGTLPPGQTGGTRIGAGATGGTAVATAPPPATGTRMAAPAPGTQGAAPADQPDDAPPAPKEKKKKGKAGKVAGKAKQRAVRKVKSRGKSAVRRQVRGSLPRF